MKIFNTSQQENIRRGYGRPGILLAMLAACLLLSFNARAQYSYSTAVQDTFGTFPGMTRAIILDVQIYTTGSASQLTEMTFNTNGTGGAGNIVSASLFYNNGGTFTSALSAGQQVGSTVTSPNGTFAFTGLSTGLTNGTNHFWLTYNLDANAVVGDSVDAELTSMIVDGSSQFPLTGAPAGIRPIRTNYAYNYCKPTGTSNNYAIGLNTFRIADTLLQYTIISSLTVTKHPAIINLSRGISYPFSYRNGTFQPNPSYENIYIDLDNDGYFDNSTELLFSGSTAVSDSSSGNLMIDCAIPKGQYRLRVMTDYYNSLSACATLIGNAFEFIIEVQDPFVSYLPVADFSKPDTAMLGSFVKFTNISGNALGYNYSWDFENAGGGFIDATTTNGVHQFNTAGTYLTKLRMSRDICGVTVYDSISKSIVIISPSLKPVSEFIADRNVTSSAITVRFTDISSWGPNKWHWKITPEILNGNTAYIYMNGTDSTSQNPEVLFLELGIYSISMFSENILGAGTMVSKVNYINNIAVVGLCNALNTKDASGFLSDENGVSSNYSNGPTTGRLCKYLIAPCASSVTFNFLDFDLNSYGSSLCPTLSGDNLKIYDGTDATGIPLHAAAGFPNGFTNNPNNAPLLQLPPSVTAASGSMYIEYFVNCSGQGRGFFGEWQSVPAKVSAPVAEFTSVDTAYTGVSYIFTNSSKGVYDQNYWDFDNDGSSDAGTKDADITFATAGTQTVKLVIERCGIPVTFSKSIRVIQQTVKPVASFTASRTTAVAGDTLRFFDRSLNGATGYSWTITPSTGVSFAAGSNSSSRNPFVVFSLTGSYAVKLVASNSFGTDSLTMNAYINVFSYCQPNIVTLGTDIGISRVAIGSINNSSAIGSSAYTRYNLSTVVERGATYAITIDRNTSFNNINRKVWIDFNKNGSFSDAGEEVLYSPSSNSVSFIGQLTIPKSIATGTVRMRVGVSSENNSNLSCGPNPFGEFEDYSLVVIDDISIPVITLLGANPLHIEQSVPFTDPGALAMDNSDGNISSLLQVTTNLDTNTVGSYFIVYHVTDLSGNKADSVVRTIIVEPDASGPVIKLLGGDTIDHRVRTFFTDPGATALDYTDGDMTASIYKAGNVDSTVIGRYYIIYNAVDLNGNAGTKVRVVNVIDDLSPVITLTGAGNMTADFGRSFADPGTTVSDNYYNGLVTTVTGSVNVNSMGTYTLTYNVTDPSGNAAQPLSRIVTVADISAPLLTLKGADSMIIDVHTKFTDPGVSVTDNHTQGLLPLITGTVDTAALGYNTITYSATDSSLNMGSVKRVVKVADRIKPVISLKGSALTVIRRWDHYTDSGVLIEDNFNSDAQLQGVLNITSTLDANKEGLYEICFNVTDLSGNKASQVCRLVSVTDANSVAEVSAEEAVVIYPNPNNGLFSINLVNDKDSRIEIYNSYGSLVHAKDIGKSAAGAAQAVDLSAEAAGIYFIRIICGESVVTRRISCLH
jgi:PKD repeat protein